LKISRFIPAIAWFIFSLVLLCLPGSTIPKYPWLALIHADKIIHIVLFCILCYLFALPFTKGNLPTTTQKSRFLFILISGITYGIVMEFVQKYWIPNRSFEMGDIVADSIGCLFTYLYFLRRILRADIQKIGPDGNRDRNQN
jgi:VanZ family protein